MNNEEESNGIENFDAEIESVEVENIPVTSVEVETPKKTKKTSIGGQALMEGLLMIGPEKTVMALRKADGSIYLEELAVRTGKERLIDKIPVIRGGFKLVRQLINGTGALMKSAEMSDLYDAEAETIRENEAKELEVEEEAEEGNLQLTLATELEDAEYQVDQEQIQELELLDGEESSLDSEPVPEKKASKLTLFLEDHMEIVITFSAILGILFSVGLFILLPRFLVDMFVMFVLKASRDSLGNMFVINLVEGLIRIIIFVSYLALTSRIKDIARVWMYHGAEHKTIACYEAGEKLTVENVRRFSRFHPRCGTSFLFIVVVVSILVFSIVGALIGINIWWFNLLLRLALIPFVAGISYEIIRFTGKHDENVVCRAVSKPGMWMQRFTTKEPDDSMIAVAIRAVEAVMPLEDGLDDW